MLRRLLPRRESFFDLFSRHAALCLEGAELLRVQIRELHADGADERAGRVHAVEHEADAVCQETIERVHGTFVTPIERGDIHDLASRLDDIMDHIEAVSQRLWLYEIRQPTPEIGEMAGNLVDAVREMKVMVDALAETRDPERMRALAGAVKGVEKANDRLLRRATARLFREEQDPKTLIKWKEVYENVEDAIDRCEDVANLIEGVALENA
jgi:predicted phosphate transport protein (TIGR00153 family)